MSTTTGQGAKNRKTMLGAMYGALAESKEVRKHLAILGRHRNAVATLAAYMQFAAKKMPGFDASRIESQKRELGRLEGLLLASFLKVSSSSETLESLAAIAKMSETPGGFSPRYRVERELLASYKAGQKSQPILLAIARFINPNFTDSDMSEWKKQYGITDLKRGKAGRKSKLPTHAEEVEALAVKFLEGTVSAKQRKKTLSEWSLQADKAWLEAQIKRPLTKIEWEDHLAWTTGRSKP